MAHQHGSQVGLLAATGRQLLHFVGNLLLDSCCRSLSVYQCVHGLCGLAGVVRGYMPGMLPGIPGMPFISFMRAIIDFIWLPVTIFIILRVWSNCLMSRFTS